MLLALIRCESLKSRGYNLMLFSLTAAFILNICEIMEISTD